MAVINLVSLKGVNRDLRMKPWYTAIIAHAALASISRKHFVKKNSIHMLIEIKIRKYPTAHVQGAWVHSVWDNGFCMFVLFSTPDQKWQTMK